MNKILNMAQEEFSVAKASTAVPNREGGLPDIVIYLLRKHQQSRATDLPRQCAFQARLVTVAKSVG